LSGAVGIDFGTSNSAAAIPGAGDEPARVLTIDHRASDVRLLRSVLFFPDGSTDILAGTAAIASYLHDFEGRFLQSIKTFLPSTAFTHTEIRRKIWKLERLIAVLVALMGSAAPVVPLQQIDDVPHLLVCDDRGRVVAFALNPQRPLVDLRACKGDGGSRVYAVRSPDFGNTFATVSTIPQARRPLVYDLAGRVMGAGTLWYEAAALL